MIQECCYKNHITDYINNLVYCRCRNGAAAPLEDFPRKDVERKRDMCGRQIRILVRRISQ